MNTRIELMDCIKGMQAMNPESVDLIVTSPPYNLGIKYKGYRDNAERSKYLQWCGWWIQMAARVMKPSSSFFLNVAGSPSNPMLPFEMVAEMSKWGFVLQNTFHWIKSITIDGVGSKGHFKPLSSKRFVNDCHEYVFHFTLSGNVELDRLAIGVPYTDKSNISRWNSTGGNDVRCRGNTWFIPYKTIRSRALQRPHPATFPEKLVENCILLHGNPSEVVMLDPFLGIGTSAISAKKCGVSHFIGFEIEQDYFQYACNALEIPPF